MARENLSLLSEKLQVKERFTAEEADRLTGDVSPLNPWPELGPGSC
jgi:hypothetical protein